jgi:hypothetical protein
MDFITSAQSPLRSRGCAKAENRRTLAIPRGWTYHQRIPTIVAGSGTIRHERLTADDFLDWLSAGVHADLIDGEKFKHSPVNLRHAAGGGGAHSISLSKVPYPVSGGGMSRCAKFEAAVMESARKLLNTAKTVREMRTAQAILLPAIFGLIREQTATAIGLSLSRIGGIQAEARNP